MIDKLIIVNQEDNEVMEDQICKRCKTHPDDVNWIQAYDDNYYESPFFLCVSTGYDYVIDKARDAIIESDSFRVFDELNMLHRDGVCIEVDQWLIKKLKVLKPNDVIKNIKNHGLSFDVATVIVSFLYGEKEQLAVLTVLIRSRDDIKCPSYHLIDDWISVNPEVIYNEQICSGMICLIESCTKTCCALIILRNVKISFEPLPIRNRYLSFFVVNCLKNKCIYMSDDLVKLSLEILDLGLDRYSEEDLLFQDGNTILHAIADCLVFPSEGCSNDKWLLFLRKVVDRFPVEILSMQDRLGHTPYDCLIIKYLDCQDEKFIKEVLDIFKPR